MIRIVNSVLIVTFCFSFFFVSELVSARGALTKALAPSPPPPSRRGSFLGNLVYALFLFSLFITLIFGLGMFYERQLSQIFQLSFGWYLAYTILLSVFATVFIFIWLERCDPVEIRIWLDKAHSGSGLLTLLWGFCSALADRYLKDGPFGSYGYLIVLADVAKISFILLFASHVLRKEVLANIITVLVPLTLFNYLDDSDDWSHTVIVSFVISYALLAQLFGVGELRLKMRKYLLGPF